MNAQSPKPTNCCEPFNPGIWQDKEVTWKGKLFVKDHVVSFLHVPLNFGQKVVQNMVLIENSNAKSAHQLMLTDEKSLWGADIYIEVSKEVSEAKMAAITGTFLTKVFEGPYKNVGMWTQEMKKYVEDKGKQIVKLYFYYTTCPKCAKVYGKNYVALFAQID
jgi:hypothetical protein